MAGGPDAAGPMNKEQNRMYLENFLTAFPGSKFEVWLTVAQGDYAVAHWKTSGTHTGRRTAHPASPFHRPARASC